MNSLAPAPCPSQLPAPIAGPSGPQPSAAGGLLILAQAWAALGGGATLGAGLHWRGKAGQLLLFVLVALPLLPLTSLRAVAGWCAGQADPLPAALGWAGAVSQRCLDRFVLSPRHDWLAVLAAMAGALARHPATAVGENGVLAVDSTTIEKRYGPQMAERSSVYDAVPGKLVDGYAVVSAGAVEGERHWSVGLWPYRKALTAAERAQHARRRRKAQEGERPSKLDLALMLVGMAVRAGVAAGTVVADSAFAVSWWLREVTALGRHWLVSLRKDRRLRIGAEVRAVEAWAKDVSLERRAVDQRGTELWGGQLPEAVLLDKGCRRKGLACRLTYMERRNRQGKVLHRWYLATSQVAWDLGAVWQHWEWRWPVEVLHRTGKQQLALEQFHVRRWEGIVAWLVCSSLRASLVAFVRAADPVCGALSTEGLAAALTGAACLVEQQADGRADVSLPPTLRAVTLWNQAPAPLPARWWPLRLKAA